MFRKLSISKTVDAMVTEKVGVGRAKVPGYSKSKWPSNKYEKRCAGSRQFIHLMLQDLSVTMKEQLPGEVCMN